jgi:hypothetical protein
MWLPYPHKYIGLIPVKESPILNDYYALGGKDLFNRFHSALIPTTSAQLGPYPVIIDAGTVKGRLHLQHNPSW